MIHAENAESTSSEVAEVKFVLHNLRRTAASYMSSIGVPRLVVSKILNHVEQGATAIYDRHSYDGECGRRWGSGG